MTLSIELTDDEERRIREAAEARGLDEAAYVRECALSEAAMPPIRNGADAVAYWERMGIVDLFADLGDSVKFAEQLRRDSSTRCWDIG